jgi:hypothetical protein
MATCDGATAKQILTAFSGSISILGSGFVLLQYHQHHHIASLVHGLCSYRLSDLVGVRREADIGAKLVTWLSLTDVFSSAFMVLGVAPLRAAEESSDGVAAFSCTVQGWSIQFFTLSTIALTTAIAVNLYLWVVRGKSPGSLQKYERRYLASAFLPNFLLASILLIPNQRANPSTQTAAQRGNSGVEPSRSSYGPAGVWCWVEDGTLGLLVFYLPLVLCWVVTFWITQVVVPKELKRRDGEGQARADHDAFSEEAITKLRHYGFVFFFIWTWGWLNRLIGLVGDDDCGAPLFFQLMHALFIPMQGFLNACVYSGLHLRAFRACWGRAASDQVRKTQPGSVCGAKS